MGIGRPRGTEQAGTISGSLVTATEEDFTLYVRTTGSDSNDGLSEGNALATIQEAVNRVPKFIKHNVLIDIGEGNFAGAYASGFMESDIGTAAGTFTVKGVLGQPTLTTGTATGTATGGSSSQLIDGGQTWTTNELRGQLLLVDGEHRVIYQNDGTTIDVINPFGASVSGKVYEILEQKTNINSAESVTGYGCISGRGNSIQIQVQDIATSSTLIGIASLYSIAPLEPTRCKFSGHTYAGYYAQDATQEYETHECAAMSCQQGYLIAQGVQIRAMDGCLAYDSTSHGFEVNLTGLGNINFDRMAAIDNGGSGIELAEVFAYVDLDNSIITGNGAYGIHAQWGTSVLDFNGTTTISNNTSGGILLEEGVIAIRLSACTGTGNGGYGLEVRDGARARVTSATTLTGSSGDVTIDDGNTPITWATDFASDGDKVVNPDNQCMIERKD